jgi:hypothetical protein
LDKPTFFALEISPHILQCGGNAAKGSGLDAQSWPAWGRSVLAQPDRPWISGLADNFDWHREKPKCWTAHPAADRW